MSRLYSMRVPIVMDLLEENYNVFPFDSGEKINTAMMKSIAASRASQKTRNMYVFYMPKRIAYGYYSANLGRFRNEIRIGRAVPSGRDVPVYTFSRCCH